MNSQAIQPWLAQAVEKLETTLHPEKVILFGSWARGTATRRSDIDLFVVWNCDLSPLQRIDTVLRLLADAPYPVEAVVYTSDELAQRCDRPFIRQLLREGEILHEHGKAPSGSSTVVSPGD